MCSFPWLILHFQVAEPLRAMVMGAPLEDARHLAQRYERMRMEAEAQVMSDMRYFFLSAVCRTYLPFLTKNLMCSLYCHIPVIHILL